MSFTEKTQKLRQRKLHVLLVQLTYGGSHRVGRHQGHLGGTKEHQNWTLQQGCCGRLKLPTFMIFFFWLDRILENFIIFHILPPCTHVCNIFTNSQYFSFHLQLKAEISFVLPWNSSNSHPNYSRADLLTQRGSAGSISIEHHLYSH